MGPRERARSFVFATFQALRRAGDEERTMANKGLNDAKKAKKDEFYTQLSDIENELRHYKEHFRGKTVLCNCDDPRVSNFFHYLFTIMKHRRDLPQNVAYKSLYQRI